MLRATVLLSLLLARLSGASAAQDAARAVNSQAAVVPNLVGQPYEQALRLVKGAQLSLGKGDSVPSHEPHGIVLSQSPEAGALVPKGTSVDLTYAIAASGTSDGPVSGTFDGPINATVPDLSGLSPVVASVRLSLAKLETGDTHSVFNQEHVGQVFRQSPGANEVVPRGSKVEFWYGFGRTVTMPDLRGSGLAAATQTIADSGLKLGRVDDPQHSGGTGPIVRQRPDPGKPVSIGSEVRLTLGRSAYVRVPPLVGLSVSAANAALAAADLVRGTSERIVSDRPPGEVLTQSPPAGDSVPRGSAVVLHLAIAAPDSAESTTVHPPTLVTVPRVIGSTMQAAATVLADSGLRLSKTRPRESSSPAGRVLAQDPAPGARVPLHSAVTLTASVPVTVARTPPGTAVDVRPEKPRPAPLIVPNLVGLRADSAEALLAALPLRAERRDTVVTLTMGGSVLRQEPVAGDTVGAGASVRLYVAKGRLLALLLVGGVVAAGGLGVWLHWHWDPVPDPKQPPPQGTRPVRPPVFGFNTRMVAGSHSVAEQAQSVIRHELQLVPNAGTQRIEANDPSTLEVT